jgi:uroporphyrinogen decarboxylase
MELSGSSDIQTDSLIEPLFLRACRQEPVEATPVWLLNQAGAYLPEHRRLREGKSLEDLVTNPDLATEATLQPIRRFGFDETVSNLRNDCR